MGDIDQILRDAAGGNSAELPCKPHICGHCLNLLLAVLTNQSRAISDFLLADVGLYRVIKNKKQKKMVQDHIEHLLKEAKSVTDGYNYLIALADDGNDGGGDDREDEEPA